MNEDISIPDFLRIPTADRRAAWDAHPPKPWPKFSERSFGCTALDAETKRRLEKDAAAEIERLDKSRAAKLSDPRRRK